MLQNAFGQSAVRCCFLKEWVCWHEETRHRQVNGGTGNIHLREMSHTLIINLPNFPAWSWTQSQLCASLARPQASGGKTPNENAFTSNFGWFKADQFLTKRRPTGIYSGQKTRPFLGKINYIEEILGYECPLLLVCFVPSTVCVTSFVISLPT